MECPLSDKNNVSDFCPILSKSEFGRPTSVQKNIPYIIARETIQWKSSSIRTDRCDKTIVALHTSLKNVPQNFVEVISEFTNQCKTH